MTTQPATSDQRDAAAPIQRASLLRRWAGVGLDLVFPPCCMACSAALETSLIGLLCAACQAEVIDRHPACPRCGAAAAPSESLAGCLQCRDEKLHFESTARLGRYDGALRRLVLRTKLEQQRALTGALGDLLCLHCGPALVAAKADVVVPIPMHWTRRLWRGANGAEIVAERVAASLRLPMAPHLLSRSRRTQPQANLSPRQRAANVRGAFRASRNRDLPGARLLLVDDIMTTGATVSEAAKVFARAGATVAAVVVLARAGEVVKDGREFSALPAQTQMRRIR